MNGGETLEFGLSQMEKAFMNTEDFQLTLQKSYNLEVNMTF